MNYLGIDYGLKQTGLALATGPLAEPLASVDTGKAFEFISRLVEKHSVKAIIIGIPDGPVRSRVQKFVDGLQSLGCQIIVVEETLSSHDARQSLSHTSLTRRQSREHAVAAAIILQSWLDSQQVSGHT
ncbi:MAG: hypothetical protein UX91_C0008G0025 [Candidatus Amesbacteria bacterium GW2011_GWB1_47_19]|nr:MAG: hypothetical protein UW51_C0002G0276 [Candidatus Amesbacteria bacterium GW2011_GWA1_44_24]KKU31055.1 MAG: hypothetical protein UX46_C0008G0075 [Candidatus Amesbacteria bacterium GW2011_GWC1_46_24]KKU66671.1 MAG: hypothetical protein UX91_C0008G0025 [Candidatus Amesbacteria bacterium GW2011_GWB1_47_19]OGD06128.1 MAG: hypothetical protein A2379_03490 [Candidatus Amesbacteria bacterium RIFOXYB1_FULL_47_13]HBC72276.1 hypothetical protein [Candidatus Amesbacteria bacterium]